MRNGRERQRSSSIDESESISGLIFISLIWALTWPSAAGMERSGIPISWKAWLCKIVYDTC